MHEPGHPNIRTPHCGDRRASHRTRKTRQDTAHDRQANTSTSTAPRSRSNTLRLPWGAQGCTEGDRRGLGVYI